MHERLEPGARGNAADEQQLLTGGGALMTKGRKAQAKRSISPQMTAALVVAAIVILVLGALALRGEDGEVGQTFGGSRNLQPVDGFSDVHGLALNPENPEEIYVATHHGLIRGTADGDWALVGDYRADFMGFTMHPSKGNVFWASGHPPGGGNIGVIKSVDGGFTWELIALPGVDFHAMTISGANPDVLWGYYRSEIYRSQDGGDAWDVVTSSPPALRSLTGDPQNADTLYAPTGGDIQRSTDGGRTWSSWADVPANALAISPTEPASIYAAVGTGIAKSTDGGETWTPTTLQANLPVGYLAVHPQDAAIIYGATYRTQTQPPELYKSSDGGETWTRLV